MRTFVIFGIALLLEACVGASDQAVVDKTQSRPEVQHEKLSASAVEDQNEHRPKVVERLQKFYAFRVALVPYVNPGGARIAEYEDGKLKLLEGDATTLEIKLDRLQSQRLKGVMETFDEEAWSGFHVSPAVDGFLVACRVNRGDDVLRFRGSNGSPSGFSALLSEIDAIVQKDFFPDYWIRNEKNSARYKDEDDALTSFRD